VLQELIEDNKESSEIPEKFNHKNNDNEVGSFKGE